MIDGQGGGIGRQAIAAIKNTFPAVEVYAVGTNSVATASMLKAGADKAASGENAVLVNCRHADIIVGPIGIVIADSLLGEVTPAMAVGIGQSNAKKILFPVNLCNHFVLGVQSLKINGFVDEMIEEIRKTMDAKL